MVATLDY